MIFIMGLGGDSIVQPCLWSQGDGDIYLYWWVILKSDQIIEKVKNIDFSHFYMILMNIV